MLISFLNIRGLKQILYSYFIPFIIYQIFIIHLGDDSEEKLNNWIQFTKKAKNCPFLQNSEILQLKNNLRWILEIEVWITGKLCQPVLSASAEKPLVGLKYIIIYSPHSVWKLWLVPSPLAGPIRTYSMWYCHLCFLSNLSNMLHHSHICDLVWLGKVGWCAV